MNGVCGLKNEGKGKRDKTKNQRPKVKDQKPKEEITDGCCVVGLLGYSAGAL